MRKCFLLLMLFFVNCSSAKIALGQEDRGNYKENSFIINNPDLRRVGYQEIKDVVIPTNKQGSSKIDDDYRIGIGDTVVISLSGKIQQTYNLEVDREGKVVIPAIGNVYIFGLSLKKAKEELQKEIEKKYVGVEVGFNITGIQPIKVSVLGYVERPGVYVLNPFSKLIEVLTAAGGPNKNGTLLNIKLTRKGKDVTVFDVYSYLFEGKENKNTALKDDDVLYVAPCLSLVAVRGDVVAPGIYEFIEGEKISDILKRCSGIKRRDETRKIIVTRFNSQNNQYETVKEILLDNAKELEKDDFKVVNEDSIMVTTLSDRIPVLLNSYKNVKILGEVENPGDYTIAENEKLSTLIKKAGGVKQSAFIEGSIFIRKSRIEEEKSNIEKEIEVLQNSVVMYTKQMSDVYASESERGTLRKTIESINNKIAILRQKQASGRIVINIGDIINGKDDFVLENGDSIQFVKNPETVTVKGEVFSEFAAKYVPNKSIQYYIDLTGGITECADFDDIFVVRANGKAINIKNCGNIESGDKIVVPCKGVEKTLTGEKNNAK